MPSELQYVVICKIVINKISWNDKNFCAFSWYLVPLMNVIQNWNLSKTPVKIRSTRVINIVMGLCYPSQAQDSLFVHHRTMAVIGWQQRSMWWCKFHRGVIETLILAVNVSLVSFKAPAELYDWAMICTVTEILIFSFLLLFECKCINSGHGNQKLNEEKLMSLPTKEQEEGGQRAPGWHHHHQRGQQVSSSVYLLSKVQKMLFTLFIKYQVCLSTANNNLQITIIYTTVKGFQIIIKK